MKKRKISIIQIFRLLVQIVLFILLPALFIQSLNGVKLIYLAILNQNFSVSLIPQFIELIALVPLTIVMGRFFCGWMCGFGSFTDFIYLLYGKLFQRKFKINRQVDGALKYLKYLILIVLAVGVWTLEISAFENTSPWDVFGMIAIIGNMPDLSYVISNLLVGTIIFVMIIIASAFVERFFCRYLCPMGAVFAISSKFRIGKIKKTSEKCGKCRICTDNCAMGISLYETDVVNSSECINCMKCIEVCPRRNVSYTVAKKDMKPLIVSAVSVAFMTGNYYGIYKAMDMTTSSSAIVVDSTETDSTTVPTTAPTTAQTTAPTTTANPTPTVAPTTTPTTTPTTSPTAATTTTEVGKYIDGTYTGSGTGFKGTIKVSVVVAKGMITNITTVSSRDDKQWYDKAFSTITKNIISSQSSDVDAVSGATYSSKGILNAVQNALSSAVN